MPYAGRDWSDVSVGQKQALAIDFAPYISAGDSLSAVSLTSALIDVSVKGTPTTITLSPSPMLTGTVASQLVAFLAAGHYSLAFTCGTTQGQVIELWSNFWSRGRPTA